MKQEVHSELVNERVRETERGEEDRYGNKDELR